MQTLTTKKNSNLPGIFFTKRIAVRFYSFSINRDNRRQKKRNFYFLFLTFSLLSSIAETQPQVIFRPFIKNLTNPVEVRNAEDGSGRLFIIEQSGKVIIYKKGVLIPKPFIDLSSRNIKKNIFQGIWSIAFSPDYEHNNTFYVLFTNKSGTKLMRYQTSKSNPDSVVLNTADVLFSIAKKGTGGPHYGDMHFGKDGFLYVTLSDGSNPKKPTEFAQDGETFSGKMLRLNVSGVNTPPYYSIPKDNPFNKDPEVRDEIVDFGFRNAWRWSFDKQTGDLWIPDIGSDRWEEVNFKKSSIATTSNFGFPCYEGNAQYILKDCRNISNYVFPIFTYPHDSSFGGQTIIGGYVYRGSAYPALKGYYLCSDFASNNLWTIKPANIGGWEISLQKGIPAAIVSYGEGEDGELYAVSLNGTIYKIQAKQSMNISYNSLNYPEKMNLTNSRFISIFPFPDRDL